MVFYFRVLHSFSFPASLIATWFASKHLLYKWVSRDSTVAQELSYEVYWITKYFVLSVCVSLGWWAGKHWWYGER
jgi:hypothetical protein